MRTIDFKKIFRAFVSIIVFFFLLIALFALTVILIAKRNDMTSSDDAVAFWGYQLRIVETESMQKCKENDVSEYKIGSIEKNSMIFVESVPEDPDEAYSWYSELKVGDVLTFRYDYSTQQTITHRIEDISRNDNGGFTIKLKGDNNRGNTDQLVQIIDTSDVDSPKYVLGRVCGKSYMLGLAIGIMKKPVGLVFCVIIPSVFIIILEVMRILELLSVNKNKKTRK